MRKLHERERVRRLDQNQPDSSSENLAVDAQRRITDTAAAITSLGEGQRGNTDLESNVFDSAAELVRSKGYRATRNLVRGIDLVAYRPVEVSARQCIIDMLLLNFQHGDGSIKVGEDDYLLQSAGRETGSIWTCCRELSEKTQRITSAILEDAPDPLASRDDHSTSSLIQGLETYSANLLLRKITFHRFNGKNVGFWISPIFLASSKLENELGEEKPWIPASVRFGETDVDIVHASNLASYLDFRNKEVKSLGKDLFESEVEPAHFPQALRMFRLLTLLAALVLLSGFLTYALSLGLGAPIAGFSFLLAAMVELFGGWRLFSSYRELSRQNGVTRSGSPRITPEQVVAHEAEFTPDELSYLYSKYGGAELSKLRKELRHQRIIELTKKAKEVFSKIRKLEAEGFYSEVVLSLDRATRSLITATLLSAGIDTQGRDITEWIPLLRKTIPNAKLEDMKSLWMLRDRINKGHDATKNETKRAKQIAEPLIDDALDSLNRFLRKQDLSQSLSASVRPPTGAYTDSLALTAQYYERLRSALSAAYSARSNGETETFLYNLEQSLGAAISIKILDLGREPPSALTLLSLLRELGKLNFRLNQDEARKWLDKLKNGEIVADNEVEEFEGFCLESLEALGVMRRLTRDEESVFKLKAVKTKPLDGLVTRELQPHSKMAATSFGESPAQEPDGSQIRISSEVLDAARSLKFLLNVVDNKELLNLGPAGIYLIEAKKTLRTQDAGASKTVQDNGSIVRQETRATTASHTLDADEDEQTASIGSKTISEELDRITESIGISSAGTRVAQGGVASSSRVGHGGTDAPSQVLAFEHLGDFKKIRSHCPIPIVASFLSDDEPSREIYDTMRSLVTKYHTRAAFISVSSKSEDIARECKIKSYPTILVFYGGGTIGELKALDADQLEHDLLRALRSIASTGSQAAFGEESKEAESESDQDADTKPAADIDKLEVTDSP